MRGVALLVCLLAARAAVALTAPGDFDWLHNPAPTLAWADAREAERTIEVRQSLRALGADPRNLESGCYGDDACQWVLDADAVFHQFGNWNTFERARREAMPYFQGYRFAALSAEDIVAPDKDATLAAQLNSLKISDQIFLKGSNFDPTKPPLPLSPGAVKLFRMLMEEEAFKRIHTETAFLKAVVRKQGWPRKSDVGADAADVAWLIAQHSDDDPAFQLAALRLMKPLVDVHEARADRYAYLYDRIMLKLAGRQRYGTQFRCVAGRMIPKSLENQSKVERYRKDAGLDPLAAYAKRFPAHCEDIGAR